MEREEDAAWGRALLVTNHLRQLLKQNAGKKGGRIKPLTLDELKGKGPSVEPAMTESEWEAYCAHLDHLSSTGTRRVLN